MTLEGYSRPLTTTGRRDVSAAALALCAGWSYSPVTRATRDGFGEALAEMAAVDERIVALGADLTGSCRADLMANQFPARYVELGIAEQNVMNVAAGLSMLGKIPYVSTYAVFMTGRALDQIRTTVCYSNLNVKIMGAHGGISVGQDGATHQALEDVAITRSLPNMIVIVPCDYWETKKAVAWSATHHGPVYVRFGREPVPVTTEESTPFAMGKASTVAEGNDLTIINNGPLLKQCLDALGLLHEAGISARLLNMATVKPIDREAIVRAASETGGIVTVEEHQVMGGFGSAVAEVVVQTVPVPMRMVGIQDRFGESGSPEELFQAFGLTAENVARAAQEVLRAKR